MRNRCCSWQSITLLSAWGKAGSSPACFNFSKKVCVVSLSLQKQTKYRMAFSQSQGYKFLLLFPSLSLPSSTYTLPLEKNPFPKLGRQRSISRMRMSRA